MKIKKQQISKNIRYQKIDIDFVLHKDDKASTRMRQAKCRHPWKGAIMLYFVGRWKETFGFCHMSGSKRNNSNFFYMLCTSIIQVISVMPDLSEVANILNRCAKQYCDNSNGVNILMVLVVVNFTMIFWWYISSATPPPEPGLLEVHLLTLPSLSSCIPHQKHLMSRWSPS